MSESEDGEGREGEKADKGEGGEEGGGEEDSEESYEVRRRGFSGDGLSVLFVWVFYGSFIFFFFSVASTEWVRGLAHR